MKDLSEEVEEFFHDLQVECTKELDPKRFIFDQGRLGRAELDNLSISLLPSSIAKITSLESINLRNNLLTSLPSSFKNLKQLREVSLSGNGLKAIPECLLRLPNIQILHLVKNQLKDLPEDISQ